MYSSLKFSFINSILFDFDFDFDLQYYYQDFYWRRSPAEGDYLFLLYQTDFNFIELYWCFLLNFETVAVRTTQLNLVSFNASSEHSTKQRLNFKMTNHYLFTRLNFTILPCPMIPIFLPMFSYSANSLIEFKCWNFMEFNYFNFVGLGLLHSVEFR
jgi:hypothetical protein